MDKTVFLTGATGNMGWSGFQELLKTNHKIKILVRPSRKNNKLLKSYKGNEKVEIIWGDLLNYADVLKGVEGSDYVLHVGGMVSPSADYFPEQTLKVNTTAAKNIVNAVLAQPNNEKIALVYIGSVAQYGDRLSPIHWGRTGDPVMASKYDKYAVSKCLAEKIIIDSGVKKWVSIRQTGMLYAGIFKQINPTAFHVPIKGVLEWATVEDSGRLLANVCAESVPDEFWNRVYNLSSGEDYRLDNYDFETRLLAPLGHSPKALFEPHWFATKNFHGLWYTDADILENYLHFRENLPVDEYFQRLQGQLPWYFSLAKFVPAIFIKLFLRKYAFERGMGTQDWVKNNESKLNAYYGSLAEFNKIKAWDLPPKFEKNLDKAGKCGEIRTLEHGYDESKSIYDLSLSEIQKAAEFRGGKFIGPVESLGEKGAIYEWECEHGHRFSSSFEYVLLAGGWCVDCEVDKLLEAASERNNFVSQIIFL